MAAEGNTQGREPLVALSTWKRWPLAMNQAPTVIGELSGGLTNTSFILRTDSPKLPLLVLRILSPYSTVYGINRAQEQYIHQRASQVGLSPQIIYWDLDLGFTVTEFFEGRVWASDDLEKPAQQTRLFEIIRQYQAIPALDLPKYDYQKHLFDYAKRAFGLLEKAEQTQWLKFGNLLMQWQTQDWEKALSHHDLIPDNIIETELGLKIIDWEYAGLGCAAFDWLSLGFDPPAGISNKDYQIVKAVQFWLNRFWQLL